MPANNFTIGKDISFAIVGPSGNLSLSGMTDYTAKPMFTKLSHKGLNGVRENAAVPDGWEITIKLDRKDPTLDNFFATLEAAYFAGTNIKNGTVSENIQEADGSVSKFQYTSACLVYDDNGSYKGDALVPQSLTINCSRRLKLS